MYDFLEPCINLFISHSVHLKISADVFSQSLELVDIVFFQYHLLNTLQFLTTKHTLLQDIIIIVEEFVCLVNDI